jgi:DNA polymerase I-like protein with 3'-5' exonuclease and polymerase domains
VSQVTKIDQNEAQRSSAESFKAHPLVRAFNDRTLAEGRERGYVTTVLGHARPRCAVAAIWSPRSPRRPAISNARLPATSAS